MLGPLHKNEHFFGLYVGVRTCETHGLRKTKETKTFKTIPYSKTKASKQRKSCQVLTPR